MAALRRGAQALDPEQWFLAPLDISPRSDGVECYQARQGDIYKLTPSLWIDQRPLMVTRSMTPAAGQRARAYLHSEEGDEPRNPRYRWSVGESVVTQALKSYGVVMNQDCELDKPHPLVTFAFIRVTDGSQHEEDLEKIRNFDRYRFFYLAEQTEDPTFPRSYIDYARLTTVDREALRPEDRVVSMSDVVREAVREWFIQYMTLDRDIDEG